MLLTTCRNAFVAGKPNKPLGQLHACWGELDNEEPLTVLIVVPEGFGSFMAPLVCQSLIAKGIPWFHFYFGSLVLSAMNLGVLAVAFYPSLAELQLEREKDLSPSSGSTPASEKRLEDLEKDLPILTNKDFNAYQNPRNLNHSTCKLQGFLY